MTYSKAARERYPSQKHTKRKTNKVNQEIPFSIIPNKEWKRYVDKFVSQLVSSMNSVMLLGGTFGLIFADVLMGGLSMGIIFTTPIPLLGFDFPPQILAFLLSFAFSAIQMMAWEALFTAKLSLLNTRTWIAISVGGLTLVLDTLIDTSVVGWLIDGTSPLAFTLEGQSFVYVALALAIAVLTGFNEILTIIFLRNYTSRN